MIENQYRYCAVRYVNDFNLANRGYQVKVQADTQHRDSIDDISRLYVRSGIGMMVPMTSLVTLSTELGPQTVDRYNQLTSIKVNGGAAATSASMPRSDWCCWSA